MFRATLPKLNQIWRMIRANDLCLDIFMSITDKLSIDNLSKLSQIGLVVIGGLALYISRNQLKIAKRNTELNIAKNEIDIFSKLNEKEKVFVDCLENYNGQNNEDFDSLQRAKEEYFRLFDTVCLYVSNESITFENFCNQYKDRIIFIVAQFKKDDFGDGSKYKNIISLHKDITSKLEEK